LVNFVGDKILFSFIRRIVSSQFGLTKEN